jgi:anti-anti-sigma factor
MNQASIPVRIDIEGELTIFTAAAVQERLLESFTAGTAIEVDLSKTSEIDSAGVQVMLAAKRAAAARELPLRFTSHSPAVLDILELCELVSQLDGAAPPAAEDRQSAP